jgi:uncharacterized protein (DUF2249 family)
MIRNIDHANAIHYGSDFLIVRSPAKDNGVQTCMKIINDEFPSPELMQQLDQEFEVCSKAKGKSIRKAFRKDKQDEHAAIVLEYVDGKNLTQIFS